MPAYLIRRMTQTRLGVKLAREQAVLASRADEALELAGPQRAGELFTDVCREGDENLIPAASGRRKTTVPSKAA